MTVTVLIDVLVLVAGFTVLVCVMVGWRVTVLVLMTVPSGASHVERRICRESSYKAKEIRI